MSRIALGCVCAVFVTAMAQVSPAGDAPAWDAGEQRLTPAGVDALLAARGSDAGLTPSARCSDLDFLRRTSLDLTGGIPSIEQTREFLADQAPDKRARLVDRLLASRAFAQHWTDVLEVAWLDRPSELQRSNRDQFRAWLQDRLAEGGGLDALVRELLLATGDQREVGAAAYVIRYGGKAGDVAGAAARHFLGVQIQCAQCHNHPYEAWTMADFRDFAAFFGRTAMVAVKGPDPKDPTRQKRVSWAVEDTGTGGRAQRVMGGMTEGETGGDRDGGMGDDDDADLTPRQRRQREKRKAEVAKRLEAMKEKNPERAQAFEWASATPRALGEATAFEVGERSRREAFAGWLTGPGRERFARALANRLWAQCFGRGLVHPIEDFSPQHPATHPALLDRLAAELVRGGYSLREFLRLLTATEAYQRSSIPSADNAGDTENYARAYVRQLSPEQAYASLFQATTSASTDDGQDSERRRRFILRARDAFIDAFVVELGNEEGDTVDAFQGSIPAALALLNGGLANGAGPDQPTGRAGRYAKGRQRERDGRKDRGGPATSTVERVMAEHAAPADRVRALYLAALVREPSAAELERCTRYLAEAGDVTEACEDLLWALVNSTEFLVSR